MPVPVMHVRPVHMVMGKLLMGMEMVVGLLAHGKPLVSVPVVFVVDVFVPVRLDDMIMKVGMRFPVEKTDSRQHGQGGDPEGRRRTLAQQDY